MKNHWLTIRCPKISLIELKDDKVFIHFESGSIYYYWEKFNEFNDYILPFRMKFQKYYKIERNVGEVTAYYIFSLLPDLRIKDKGFYIDRIQKALDEYKLKLRVRGMIFDAVKLHGPNIRKLPI